MAHIWAVCLHWVARFWRMRAAWCPIQLRASSHARVFSFHSVSAAVIIEC
jgi:hypothetical protein